MENALYHYNSKLKYNKFNFIPYTISIYYPIFIVFINNVIKLKKKEEDCYFDRMKEVKNFSTSEEAFFENLRSFATPFFLAQIGCHPFLRGMKIVSERESEDETEKKEELKITPLQLKLFFDLLQNKIELCKNKTK